MADLEGLNFTMNFDDKNQQQQKPYNRGATASDTNNDQTEGSEGQSVDKPQEQSSFFSGLASILTGSGHANENTYQSPASLATPQSMSNETFDQNQQQTVDPNAGFLSTANNPTICIFHLLFKGLSIFCFIFINVLLGDEITTFILVVIFSAFDFWTVKNITGRLLVNLRWWSEIDETGEEVFHYESDDGKKRVGKTDSFVFWTALYCYPLIWLFFGLIDLLSFKFLWIILCGICFTLSFMNAANYYFCQRDQKSKLQSFMQDQTQSFLPKILGSLGSSGSSMTSLVLGGLKNKLAEKVFGAKKESPLGLNQD